MGHAILGKDLVRNVESASIPQFLNESFDDVFSWLHIAGPLIENFNLSQRCQGGSIASSTEWARCKLSKYRHVTHLREDWRSLLVPSNSVGRGFNAFVTQIDFGLPAMMRHVDVHSQQHLATGEATIGGIVRIPELFLAE